MIASKEDMPGGISIDLTGPEGNAYCLMGYAKNFSKQLDIDGDKVIAEMTADGNDYEDLVAVFDSYFGSFCTLYR